jgi:hypothetical protein
MHTEIIHTILASILYRNIIAEVMGIKKLHTPLSMTNDFIILSASKLNCAFFPEIVSYALLMKYKHNKEIIIVVMMS